MGAAEEPQRLFDHQKHNELGLECTTCHAVDQTESLTKRFPTVSICLQCHRAILADHTVIQNLVKLPSTVRLNPKKPVYDVPDYVFFAHSVHLKSGISCESCHGQPLANGSWKGGVKPEMKACMDCHKARKVSNECNLCHDLGQ